MILPDIIDSEERCVRIKGYQPFNHSTCGRFNKLSLSVPVIFVGFLMSNVSEQQMFEHLQEWKGELGFCCTKNETSFRFPHVQMSYCFDTNGHICT